jgi:phosphoribosylglycinamide formyltransferase-1
MPENMIGVLASGRGSNLSALIDAIDTGKLNAKIAVVLSDNPDAAALLRAREKNIPAKYVNRQEYRTKAEFETALLAILAEYRVELVVLAGFMRLLSKHFVDKFPIMNIHPSLLPAFPGANAQKQALDYGVKVSGCTVHFVDEGMDTGPVILQKCVPVLKNDTVDSLSARILAVEHDSYYRAIELYFKGELEISGRTEQ